MRKLTSWLVGIAWAGWGAVPVLAFARPMPDLLAVVAWCGVGATMVVALLWVLTLTIRR